VPGGRVLIVDDESDALELSSIVSAQWLGGVRERRLKTAGLGGPLPYHLLP